MAEKIGKGLEKRMELAEKSVRGGNKAHASDITLSHGSQLNEGSYPDTELRVLQVAEMICSGKSKESCLKFVMEAKDVSLQQAKYYYQAAVNYLIPEDLEEYRKQVMMKNFRRLERIIEKGMTDDKDLRLAKEAIAEVNKMLGLSGNKVTMARNGQGDEIIQINFD